MRLRAETLVLGEHARAPRRMGVVYAYNYLAGELTSCCLATGLLKSAKPPSDGVPVGFCMQARQYCPYEFADGEKGGTTVACGRIPASVRSNVHLTGTIVHRGVCICCRKRVLSTERTRAPCTVHRPDVTADADAAAAVTSWSSRSSSSVASTRTSSRRR